jgi:hypothetical protein
MIHTLEGLMDGPAGQATRYRAWLHARTVRIFADVQGRVLIFSSMGMPIGQVLLPGRERGHNMRSTSMAIRPGTDELLIVTNDWDKGEGSTIFSARAFGRALPLYGHQ